MLIRLQTVIQRLPGRWCSAAAIILIAVGCDKTIWAGAEGADTLRKNSNTSRVIVPTGHGDIEVSVFDGKNFLLINRVSSPLKYSHWPSGRRARLGGNGRP
jgi:hypothetical protein